MKKLLLGLSFSWIILNAFGQEEKIIIIDKGAGSVKSTRYKKERKLVDNISVMKFSPLQMMVGEINFGYERKINELTSFEVCLGPTLSEIGLTVSGNHYSDPWGNYSSEYSKMGFFTSVGFRFYPMDNGKVLNGFYVSPVFKYRLKNFGTHDYSEALKDISGSESHANFTFEFGDQIWLSEHFSLDFYAGLGLGYESHKHYFVASAYNPDTQLYDYFWDENFYSGVRYLFTAGIKVGIGN